MTDSLTEAMTNAHTKALTEAMSEMPRYRTRHEIHALKIRGVEKHQGAAWLIPDDEQFKPFSVSPEFVIRYSPEPGGYYVVSEGERPRFVVAEVFEKCYAPV